MLYLAGLAVYDLPRLRSTGGGSPGKAMRTARPRPIDWAARRSCCALVRIDQTQEDLLQVEARLGR
jgi:hypothetical protein